MRRHFNFTECTVLLLIVVAGIAVAAPVLRVKIDAARKYACEDRLRLLGQAGAMYIQEYRHIVPAGKWETRETRPLWTQSLAPYYGMGDRMTGGKFRKGTAFQWILCPDDGAPFMEDEAEGEAHFGTRGVSYAINRRIAGVLPAKVAHPKWTTLFFDAMDTFAGDEKSRENGRFDHYVGVLFGMNVLTMDGSVSTYVEENADTFFRNKYFSPAGK